MSKDFLNVLKHVAELLQSIVVNRLGLWILANGGWVSCIFTTRCYAERGYEITCRSPTLIGMYRSVRRLQRSFPIDDILFQ